MNRYSKALDALNECVKEGREVLREICDEFGALGFDFEEVYRKSLELLDARLHGWPEMPGIDVLPWNGTKGGK